MRGLPSGLTVVGIVIAMGGNLANVYSRFVIDGDIYGVVGLMNDGRKIEDRHLQWFFNQTRELAPDRISATP